MPPSTRRTTTLRVVLALLFAYGLPSLVLGQAYYWTSPIHEVKTAAEAAMWSAPSLIMGLLLGWPYVLGAAGCWAVLDQFDRHYLWAAAVVGLGAGAGAAIFGLQSLEHVHVSMCLVLGVVTALGVWWIAYARQDRLPAPRALPRPRLVI